MPRPLPRIRMATLALCSLAALACATDLSTSPASVAGTKAVSFSVATSGTTGANGVSGSRRASFDVVSTPSYLLVVSGADTLQIDSIRVVLAQVSLARAADSTCGVDGHNDSTDVSCAPLGAGPLIVKLPLTAGASQLFSVPVPNGAYTGIALRVHKPNRDDSGPNEVAFLAAHPDWENVSIRVDGTFDGHAVHWHGDPELQVKTAFSPAVVVSDSTGLNFTLRVDIASWFKASNGALIDPANVAGALYPQVANNIAHSFQAFVDDHKTGADDHSHDNGGE